MKYLLIGFWVDSLGMSQLSDCHIAGELTLQAFVNSASFQLQPNTAYIMNNHRASYIRMSSIKSDDITDSH